MIFTSFGDECIGIKWNFFFFIYAQDMETYKQTGKDDIAEWQAALKARNIPDWLIVVVTGEDRVKTKLLQRASVADKVKSDFCGKYTDRLEMAYLVFLSARVVTNFFLIPFAFIFNLKAISAFKESQYMFFNNVLENLDIALISSKFYFNRIH